MKVPVVLAMASSLNINPLYLALGQYFTQYKGCGLKRSMKGWGGGGGVVWH